MPKKSPVWLLAVLLLGVCALVSLVHAQAPAKGGPAPSTAPVPGPNPEIKRLILKDGSYQPLVRFDVQGDRVRYLSAERYEWEELPFSLIDWAATEQYAREHSGQVRVSAEAKAIDAEVQAERQHQEELTPLVAPGLRLPQTGGIFLLDVYNRQAQLNELLQNVGELKRNTGKNVLRATVNPLSSAKQSIELAGQHARIQSHVDNPFIYVDIDEDSDQSGSLGAGVRALSSKPDTRFRIVRVESVAKKNVRVVGNVKVAIYGKVSQEGKFVPAKTEAFSGPWLKITPLDPLPAGEYAVVEMLGDNQMNLYVWDFGVNPNAPENPDVWRPEGAPAASVAPVLNPR